MHCDTDRNLQDERGMERSMKEGISSKQMDFSLTVGVSAMSAPTPFLPREAGEGESPEKTGEQWLRHCSPVFSVSFQIR